MYLHFRKVTLEIAWRTDWRQGGKQRIRRKWDKAIGVLLAVEIKKEGVL